LGAVERCPGASFMIKLINVTERFAKTVTIQLTFIVRVIVSCIFLSLYKSELCPNISPRLIPAADNLKGELILLNGIILCIQSLGSTLN